MLQINLFIPAGPALSQLGPTLKCNLLSPSIHNNTLQYICSQLGLAPPKANPADQAAPKAHLQITHKKYKNKNNKGLENKLACLLPKQFLATS